MTQNQKILAYLRKGKSLTAIQALHKFQCFRLASRIAEIREHREVKSETVKRNGKHFSKYFLNTH